MSIVIIERTFLNVKVVKTRLYNKMGDDFLSNNLVVYIEKKITENLNTDFNT